MPELPEVETVCRGLAAHAVGRRIASLQLRRATLRFPIPPEIPVFAAGQKILRIERASKYILIVLEKGERLLIHLGMSGRMFFHDDPKYKPEKHDHVVIHFEKGGVLVFNDARRFGLLDYLAPKQGAHRLLDVLGIDPLSDALTPEFLLQKFGKKSVSMKAVLMDQRVIAGLGNIYVSEALYRAGIWPERLAKSLTKPEAKKLVKAIVDVLNDAIDKGGSSLRDYVQTSGEMGYFQHNFRVYGRNGQPCRKCKNDIVKMVQAGRSTFACPVCQQ